MQLITAPSRQKEKRENHTSIFMAGGITDCPNWQQEMIDELDNEKNLVLYNPRRDAWDMTNPNATQEQIEWEFTNIHNCTGVSFWFPCETLCPIVLYELGKISNSMIPIFVGCHPEYKRLQDVRIQTKLLRPGICVHTSFADLIQEIRDYLMNCRKQYRADFKTIKKIKA